MKPAVVGRRFHLLRPVQAYMSTVHVFQHLKNILKFPRTNSIYRGRGKYLAVIEKSSEFPPPHPDKPYKVNITFYLVVTGQSWQLLVAQVDSSDTS